MPLENGIATIVQMVQDLNAKPRWEGTPEEGRASYLAFTHGTRTPEQIVPVASVEDSSVSGAEGPLKARIYRPEGTGLFPTVVYFHGGGWVIGDLDTHDNMCRSLCQGSQAVVVSVDYRLAPEYRFPAAVEDAIAATQWVQSHAARLGGSAVVGIAGDSAGGNLAAVVCQALRGQSPALKAQLLVYPAVDHLGAGHRSIEENAIGYLLEKRSMQWFYQHYVGDCASTSDPRLFPLQAPDLGGLPPALIITAQFDPLRDEGEAYGQALEAAGVHAQTLRYDGMVHGFYDMGRWSTGAQQAIDESTAMFGKLLRS